MIRTAVRSGSSQLVIHAVSRELRDGKDEHQIEEQLDVGNAAAFVAAARAKMTELRRKHPALAAVGWHGAAPGLPTGSAVPGNKPQVVR